MLYQKEKSPNSVVFMTRKMSPWQLIWFCFDSSKTHFYVDFKDVSHLETCKDYFAIVEKKFFCLFGLITLTSQFLWPNCFDRTIENSNFHNIYPEMQNDPSIHVCKFETPLSKIQCTHLLIQLKTWCVCYANPAQWCRFVERVFVSILDMINSGRFTY